MILPDKYIKPSESYIYISTLVITELKDYRYSITDLWLKIKNKNKKLSYNKYLQIIIYLYTIGLISYTEKGEIFNENYKNLILY